MATLYVGFKGNGNSSNKIVSNLTGEKLYLTNSYTGIRKDIENIRNTYDAVYMFGLDKTLKGNIRIDCVAKRDDVYLYSDIDFDRIAEKLNERGIITSIGNAPKQSLCNEAYWLMLKKYNCHVIFLHVPSIKFITESFIERVQTALIRKKVN